MKTIVLSLTNAEIQAVRRARLVVGSGVRESKALLSAQDKLDAALSREGNAFNEIVASAGDVLELFSDRDFPPAAVGRLIRALGEL